MLEIIVGSDAIVDEVEIGGEEAVDLRRRFD